MKQITLFGLIIIILTSCSEPNQDKPLSVKLLKRNSGKSSDVKIISANDNNEYLLLTFFPNGELEMLREFANGKENGKHFRWRENGRLAIEGFKVNGEYDRVTREVYDDGRTAFEGKRTDTEFEGINNRFYKSGALERRWYRTESKKFGRSIYYHENGLVKEIGNYLDTGYILIGKWNENGEAIK